jgi:hypothetical protein
MPKGVYDRSKAKKKASTEKTFATATAPVPTKRAYKKAATQQLAPKATALLDTPTVSQAPHELYNHIQILSQTRANLSGVGDHNPAVLGALDSEIQNTVVSLKNWREANYPTTTVTAKTDNGTVTKQIPVIAETPVAKAPVVQQAAPAPYVPPTPPAPLPFTPQAVQDVLKHTS